MSFQGIFGSERDHVPSQGKILKMTFGILNFGFWVLIFPLDLVNLKALCGASGGQEGFFDF